MSTISVSGLSQFFQSVSVTSPTQANDATVQSGATTDSSSATDSSASQQVQGGHHHHHGGGGGGAFFSKIQSAVTSALQQAQSGDATDPNQAIQNAIASVMEGGNSSADGTATSTDPSATDPNAAATASSDPQQSQIAFFQTLQQFGVDPQQFHQDFLAALQDAQQNGNADPSSVFGSFPPGTAVDTTA